MNSAQRLRLRQMKVGELDKYPEKLTLISRDAYPKNVPQWAIPDGVYVSRHFMVQLFHEGNAEYPNLIRLSVNRIRANVKGWIENITWEELQEIKAELGFANKYAIEIYPRAQDVVNVANMRHLWLLETPLSIGWFGKGGTDE